jgi:hypothetical protein
LHGKIFTISIDLAILESKLDCDHLEIITFLTRRNQNTAHTIILDILKRMIGIGIKLDSQCDHAGSSVQFDRISSAFEGALSIYDDQSCEYVFPILTAGVLF